MTDIKYFTNDLIDRNEWDEWVRGAKNRRIYASSSFLDIFSPSWDALVIGNGDAFMPLTWSRKFGIRYMFQPIFVQQLGLFCKEDIFAGRLPDFINLFSGLFRYADIALNETNNGYAGTQNCAMMDNYLMRLDLPYEKLAMRYSSNSRRNIIKSQRLGTFVMPSYCSSEVVNLFAGYQGKKYPAIRSVNYMRLKRLLDLGIAGGFIEVRHACRSDGKIIASACFLKDYDRIVFYFSANTREGRLHGAMFRLIDSFIRKYSGTGLLLDFNGSVNPGIARFYEGFGAEPVQYPRLKINRLWYPARLFKH